MFFFLFFLCCSWSAPWWWKTGTTSCGRASCRTGKKLLLPSWPTRCLRSSHHSVVSLKPSFQSFWINYTLLHFNQCLLCLLLSRFNELVITYLSFLDLLGGRLEAAEDATLQAQACLCYICARNVEKLVSCWTRAKDGHCPLSLQVCKYAETLNSVSLKSCAEHCFILFITLFYYIIFILLHITEKKTLNFLNGEKRRIANKREMCRKS